MDDDSNNAVVTAPEAASLFEIKSWFSGRVLFSLTTTSFRLCVEAAVKAKVSLENANLNGAKLNGAELNYAELNGAKLNGAELNYAELNGAKLNYAELNGAKLNYAELNYAELNGAKLNYAELNGAELNGAKLNYAELNGAKLTPIRDDLWAVLSAVPAEVAGLRQSLVDGKINGSVYEGECACLVGTLANVRHCRYDAIPALKPNSSRPAERWFFNLRPGDTPEKSNVAAITLVWIDEWLSGMRAAFGALPAA